MRETRSIRGAREESKAVPVTTWPTDGSISFMTFAELTRSIGDDVILELVEAIEKLHESSHHICCVHVNEEATSNENVSTGSKLFTWISDTGVLAFRASGLTGVLRVMWHGKCASEESEAPKAYASGPLDDPLSHPVLLMLLDPASVANITELCLGWARNAGDTVWDVELSSLLIVSCPLRRTSSGPRLRWGREGFESFDTKNPHFRCANADYRNSGILDCRGRCQQAQYTLCKMKPQAQGLGSPSPEI